MPLTTTAVPTHRYALPDAARHIAWDGSALVVACDDGTILLLQTPVPGVEVVDRLDVPPTALATRPDRVVVGGIDGTLLDRSARGRLVTDAGGTVTAAAFIGESLAIAARTHVLLRDDTSASSLDLGVGSVTGLAAVTTRFAAVIGTHGLAWIDTGLLVCDGRLELPTMVSAAIDPRQRCVALGDLGGSIHVVAFRESEVDEITGYPDRVESLAFSSDGNWLCATAADEVTAWPVLDDGRVEADEPRRLIGHDHEITAFAATSSDGLAASGDTAGEIRLWRPAFTDEPIASLRVDGVVLAIAWRADARALAVASSAGDLLLVDVNPGELL
jgi:hypothetical protein